MKPPDGAVVDGKCKCKCKDKGKCKGKCKYGEAPAKARIDRRRSSRSERLPPAFYCCRYKCSCNYMLNVGLVTRLSSASMSICKYMYV